MKKQNLIYVILGGLLVLSLGYNIVSQKKSNEIIDIKTTEISQIDSVKNELQRQYDSTIVKLDDAQLNIDNLKTENYKANKEINSLKKKIKSLVYKSKLSKKEIVVAKKLITELNIKVNFYITENEKLKKENEKLFAENRNLTMQNNQLGKVLLTTKEENDSLKQKVDLGSTLTVSNVLATSLKDNNRKTKKASKVGKLRLTFVVNENRISTTESKTLYLVLVNPLGEVVEGSEKSDALSTKKEGEKLYTSKTNIEYTTGLIKNVNFDTDFSKILVDGLYKVQLYENGYKISETRLVLKKNKILGFL